MEMQIMSRQELAESADIIGGISEEEAEVHGLLDDPFPEDSIVTEENGNV